MVSLTHIFSKALLTLLVGQSAALSFLPGIKANNLQLASVLGIDGHTARFNPEKIAETAISRGSGSEVPARRISIPIDHEDPSVGTYQNRYWVSADFYKPGGPVFVLDAGEGNAYSVAQSYLGGSDNFFAEYLKEFNGLGLVWEHRYYGDSLPFPVNTSTPNEHFKYLTNSQALADLPYFAEKFTLNGTDLSPKSSPWIMLGGSYPGMRAAFTRNEYPDTIFASFAMSAPVEARVNMTIYFEQVYRGMVANGLGGCAKDLKAINDYIDSQLDKKGQAADAIKTLFLGKEGIHNSNGDFTAALGSIYNLFQSYGVDGGEESLSQLCSYLDKGASPNGIARKIGVKELTEKFAAWPPLLYLINQWGSQVGDGNSNCKGQNNSTETVCELGGQFTDPDTISWTWQYCTEWGYLQADNVGPHSLLSKYQSLEYQQSLCYRQFPGAKESGLLPEHPEANETNAETGGWTIRPSNVFWSAGEFDPWRTLTPLSNETFAPKGVQISTNIPKCGVETPENVLFGYVIPRAEHCFDYDLSYKPADKSRKLFSLALKKWLPCWRSEHAPKGVQRKWM
ncbi:serine carboxypeptidase S28-domain-containing protein [Aspergillus minisclerotigenes]|uniref:Serine carboxypeptidase S28-domain-containing protein n=1 Tax=Aspergillus minisclerotigenes TaxID=656917 RepID=A0A5N6JEF6_9EURO|nr:serine carboxypeptidase S28-domain-containing protein [Aspergillus minisclerotigenes]